MLLNANSIFEKLNTLARQKIQGINVFDIADSTNDIAMTHAKENPTRNEVFFAEEQTKGRGQFDRTWVSPKGNIYCSLTWCFEKKLNEITGLSLHVGSALCTALKAYGIQQEIAIKYPNDLLFDNKKFAGILIETFAPNNTQCVAIIGIGINVTLPKNTQDITQPWTSLSEITHTSHDRNKLAAQVLNTLCGTLNTL